MPASVGVGYIETQQRHRHQIRGDIHAWCQEVKQYLKICNDTPLTQVTARPSRCSSTRDRAHTRTVSTIDPQGISFGSCNMKEDDNDGKWGADATWVLPSGLKNISVAFLPISLFQYQILVTIPMKS